jgi:hypothetical protein
MGKNGLLALTLLLAFVAGSGAQGQANKKPAEEPEKSLVPGYKDSFLRKGEWGNGLRYYEEELARVRTAGKLDAVAAQRLRFVCSVNGGPGVHAVVPHHRRAQLRGGLDLAAGVAEPVGVIAEIGTKELDAVEAQLGRPGDDPGQIEPAVTQIGRLGVGTYAHFHAGLLQGGFTAEHAEKTESAAPARGHRAGVKMEQGHGSTAVRRCAVPLRKDERPGTEPGTCAAYDRLRRIASAAKPSRPRAAGSETGNDSSSVPSSSMTMPPIWPSHHSLK